MTKKKKLLLIKIALILNILLVLLLTIYLFLRETEKIPQNTNNEPQVEEEVSSSTIQKLPEQTTSEIIGYSVNNQPIESYNFGNGKTNLLFVGGMHGGYEWNSVLLAYTFIDELESENIKIPESISIKVIPSLNPDGLSEVTKKEGRFEPDDIKISTKNGEGRFNANNVDLNRNFACKWQPNSTWRNRNVSGGTSAFSEPESQALQKLVDEYKPDAVIFWHSQANAVYASECEKGILPETIEIMNTYANSSGYKAISTFDAYPVTGDAEGWLASLEIPAITVELSSHDSIEWDRNKAGIEAILQYYQ